MIPVLNIPPTIKITTSTTADLTATPQYKTSDLPTEHGYSSEGTCEDLRSQKWPRRWSKPQHAQALGGAPCVLPFFALPVSSGPPSLSVVRRATPSFHLLSSLRIRSQPVPNLPHSQLELVHELSKSPTYSYAEHGRRSRQPLLCAQGNHVSSARVTSILPTSIEFMRPSTDPCFSLIRSPGKPWQILIGA